MTAPASPPTCEITVTPVALAPDRELLARGGTKRIAAASNTE
jgi:hypothetical protein